ncbi:hypothetical protein POVWA1_070270 [Plasmodium ovale wallikeri]|uniref:Uncharacterized protein n=1 Tax=Plasmodium ovale wallikeri TaxID=864142 RepID=A0A1A9AH10_PLAOA|nr:hypothetical protein POVWA1_070270 [Plasmodium ovale wallikeri]
MCACWRAYVHFFNFLGIFKKKNKKKKRGKEREGGGNGGDNSSGSSGSGGGSGPARMEKALYEYNYTEMCVLFV